MVNSLTLEAEAQEDSSDPQQACYPICACPVDGVCTA
jgi:hypothetical protein